MPLLNLKFVALLALSMSTVDLYRIDADVVANVVRGMSKRIC
jgi:hypothetical protein